MTVVVISNPLRDRYLESTLAVRTKLIRLGHRVIVAMPEGLEEHFPNDPEIPFVPVKDCAPEADLFVTMGGDGTILHASKLAVDGNVPILGVNMGSKGFMAGLEKSQLDLFDTFSFDSLRTEKRMMLDVELRRENGSSLHSHALNDAVISKGAISKIIKLNIFAGENRIMNFPGDGVIICTPTGSTAYSLSAGGPIVEPEADNIIITPICAHAIYAQPRVLSGRRTVEATLDSPNPESPAYLIVDGDAPVEMKGGDRVIVTRSERTCTLARMDGVDFFTNVERKLNTQKQL